MNRMSRRSAVAGLATSAAALALAFPASAQAFPQRNLRIIVPFVPGGSSDTLARIMAELLRDRLGQSVVVENRAGGNSVVAMSAAAAAPPDGYTMLIGHIGTHAITPAITPPSGYDVAKTFATLAVLATSSNFLIVRPDLKIDSLRDLIALAKSKPGALNYGSPGVGSPSHMSIVQLAAMTGINVVHVSYRGNAAALTDMLGGTLDFMFASPAECIEHVRSGKLKAIAVSAAQRSPAMPELPTAAEAGVPGYDFRTWHVLSVRSDTPPDIIAKLRQAVAATLASEPMRKRLADLSLDAGIANGEEAERFVQAQIALWAKVVKEAGVRGE
jgi:tripartite-type tricarboxylate transporter receptor subunit TctC